MLTPRLAIASTARILMPYHVCGVSAGRFLERIDPTFYRSASILAPGRYSYLSSPSTLPSRRQDNMDRASTRDDRGKKCQKPNEYPEMSHYTCAPPQSHSLLCQRLALAKSSIDT